jgi:outer membrane immunogenic protein
MRNYTTFAALTAALLLGTVSANAADIFGGGSTKDSPSDVVSYKAKANWTGLYIGGRVGIGNADHELSVQGFEFDEAEKEEIATGGFRDLITLGGLSSSGFVGGGQVGFDKQIGRFVLGAFGSYDFTNMETTLDFADVLGGENFSLEKDHEWDAGIRAGVLVNPDTLVYALVAYTQTQYSLSGPGVSEVPGLDTEKTFSGVKVGGGIEFAATNNIFLGLEGTHSFYGDETWFSSCDGECGGEDTQVNDDLEETKILGTLKIKLNSNLGGF